MAIKTGTVIKSVGGVFTVGNETGKYVCFAPKKIRYFDLDVVVGDKVRFEELKHGKGVVVEVLPRKNKLARPEIANVDVCFVVLACEPQADFYLCDKVLINCFQEQIEPVIVVNKSDIASQLLDEVEDNYRDLADIVSVSAMNDSVKKLATYIDNGKLGCFAGQSAVGKTSILNAMSEETVGATGGISQKSGRGVHTTRYSSLHKVAGGFLADTCGFSLCELHDIRSDELRLYLDDFVTVAHDCRFSSCTHTVEPDCAVISAVQKGKISANRYKRYVEEYNELKESEKNRY